MITDDGVEVPDEPVYNLREQVVSWTFYRTYGFHIFYKMGEPYVSIAEMLFYSKFEHIDDFKKGVESTRNWSQYRAGNKTYMDGLHYNKAIVYDDNTMLLGDAIVFCYHYPSSDSDASLYFLIQKMNHEKFRHFLDFDTFDEDFYKKKIYPDHSPDWNTFPMQ